MYGHSYNSDNLWLFQWGFSSPMVTIRVVHFYLSIITVNNKTIETNIDVYYRLFPLITFYVKTNLSKPDSLFLVIRYPETSQRCETCGKHFETEQVFGTFSLDSQNLIRLALLHEYDRPAENLGTDLDSRPSGIHWGNGFKTFTWVLHLLVSESSLHEVSECKQSAFYWQ